LTATVDRDWRELALYVQAGIPAHEVLRIATLNGARIAGQGATRGRIERGYAADLVLVDGDPSQDITDLRKASLVIQGDVAYAPDRIYEAMGFKPFVAGAVMEAPPRR
jgi:imidazolonepropionase-like amidohydrolase